MQFLQKADGVWLLINETAPADANVIATVRGPAEVLALKGLCEARLDTTDFLRPFGLFFEGRDYRLTPYSDRGERVSMRIDGNDGSLARVETEFGWPVG